jgi:hypothetical protein
MQARHIMDSRAARRISSLNGGSECAWITKRFLRNGRALEIFAKIFAVFINYLSIIFYFNM